MDALNFDLCAVPFLKVAFYPILALKLNFLQIAFVSNHNGNENPYWMPPIMAHRNKAHETARWNRAPCPSGPVVTWMRQSTLTDQPAKIRNAEYARIYTKT